MDLRFLLAHHPPEQYHRCVRLGPLHLCARCLGMYPPLVAGFVAELLLHRHHAAALAPRPHEAILLCAMTVPAILDWVRGRIRPESGSNATRMATGALLGLALGRVLYLNARSLFASPAREVILFLVVCVVLGEMLARGLGPDGAG